MNPRLLASWLALHELRLVAGQEVVVTVEIPETSSYSSVELVSLDGTAPIYFRWNGPAVTKAFDVDVFPAVVGTVQIPVPGYGSRGVPTADLHLVSDGAPLVSIIRR